MAKTKSSNRGLITGAAEIIGGALGTIAGTINRLRADHAHPAREVKEASTRRVRKPAVQSRRTGNKIPKKANQAVQETVKSGKKVLRRPKKTSARRRAGDRPK